MRLAGGANMVRGKGVPSKSPNVFIRYIYVIDHFQVAMQPMRPKGKGKGALGVRCDFIGSSTNLVNFLYP